MATPLLAQLAEILESSGEIADRASRALELVAGHFAAQTSTLHTWMLP